MFSRHPLDRLFSAYRNKFLDPVNTAYLKHYGHMIVTNEAVSPLAPHPKRPDGLYKISFEQFVRFVLKAGPDFDDHWRPQTRICHICDVQYTYLGKFETLQQDSNTIFRLLNDTTKFPKQTEYSVKTTVMLAEYYAKLPTKLMKGILKFYKNDFEAFGYDPHYFTKKNVRKMKNYTIDLIL